MANPNLDEISSATHKFIVPKMVDNILNSNSLLARWRKKPENYMLIDGGADLNFPLLYAVTSASGSYAESGTLDNSANDQISAATFDYRQYYASIVITRLAELKNSGKAQVINYVKAKAQAAEKTLADNIGTGMFSADTSGNGIRGLRTNVLASGTAGKINSSTYSWWKSQADTTTTTFSLSFLQSLDGDCTVDNDRPTVFVTTQDIYDSIVGSIQPAQRFTDKSTADAGFKNIMFAGRPVVVDSHVTAQYLFALNESYIGMLAHKDENFRFEPFRKPENKNVSYAHIFWAGEQWINNRRMHGYASGLTG
jgi:hypothetical protein